MARRNSPRVPDVVPVIAYIFDSHEGICSTYFSKCLFFTFGTLYDISAHRKQLTLAQTRRALLETH